MSLRSVLPFVGGSRFFASNKAFAEGGGASKGEVIEGEVVNEKVIDDEAMTATIVKQKLGILFGIFFAGVAVSLFVFFTLPIITAFIFVGIAFVATIILAIINAFSTWRGNVHPTIVSLYAFFEGVIIAGISLFFAFQYDGIIITAVIATACVVGASYLAYSMGWVKVDAKFLGFLGIATIAYLIFALVNLILVLTGVLPGFGMFSMAFGPIISLVAIGLGALMLIADFGFIDNGIKNKLPAKYAWTAGFGILLDIIWIYMEILRLLAVLQNRR